MCGGKLIVGAALGYREVELKAFGTNRRERAKRFEENLIAIKRLWTEDSVDMVGSHFELSGATCLPKPFQNPSADLDRRQCDPAIERAARMGDCWYINPHNEISTVIRQMEIYKRALDAANKPFPDELPMRREVFVAPTKAEALRLCGPYLAGKYENIPIGVRATNCRMTTVNSTRPSTNSLEIGSITELARRGRRADHRSTPQSWNQSPYYEHGLGRHAARSHIGLYAVVCRGSHQS